MGVTARRLLPYGIPIVASAVALALKALLGPTIVPSVFLTFYGAVVAAAWAGGFASGVMATGWSAALCLALFLPPLYSAAGFDPISAVRVGLFVVSGVGVSWFVATLHRARDELRVSVRERTLQLSSANETLARHLAEARHTAAMLRETEERFSSAFAHAPIGMALVRLDGRPMQVNRALCDMLGYTPAELLATTAQEVTHPEDMPEDEAALARLLRGDSASYQIEKRYIHKAGQLVWASLSVSLVRDAEGAPVHCVVQVQDISDRKRAEQALRESELKFRSLAETVTAAIFIFQGTQLLYVNPAAVAITGYARDELLQSAFWRIIHPDFRDLVRTRGLARQGGTAVPSSYEVKIVTKSGEERWVDFTGGVIEFSGGPAVLGTAFEITARKQAEAALRRAHDELEARVSQRTTELRAANARLQTEIAQREQTEQALRESQGRFQAIFAQAAVGVSLTGLDGRWLLVNDKLCQILGYSRDELLGLSFREVTHPDDLPASDALVRQLLADEASTYTADKRYLRKDGQAVWASLTASVVRDAAGKAQYGIAVVEDITERKRAEEALRRSEELTRRILDSITDGFFVLDHAGCFTYLNPSAEQLLQRPAAALLGRQIWKEFPEAVGGAFHKQYQHIMTERLPSLAEAYYPPLKRWLKARSYPSQAGVAVLLEDITERHAQEITLFSNILHTLNAHLGVTAAFQQIGAGLQTLTGCDRSSLVLFDEAYEVATVTALDQPRHDLGVGTRLRLADIPAAADVLVGRPHIVPNLAAELHSPVVRMIYADGLRSALSLPLRGLNQILGMLTLTWRREAGPDLAHVPLLTQIAGAVALAVEKDRLFEEVRAGRARLEALSHRLLEVQETERRHIARELHDEIGQGLTALRLVLDATHRLPADAARSRLRELSQLVDDLLTRVRNLSLDLRPGMLDDLGLLPALLWLFGRYSSQTNVHVVFEHSGLNRRYAPDVETAAYRIVQEALTNVARHAGGSEVTVRAWADTATLRVQVTDQGSGFDPGTVLAGRETSGLAGMRERAVLLGGQFSLESAPGGGTRLSAEFPLQPEMEGDGHAHHRPVG